VLRAAGRHALAQALGVETRHDRVSLVQQQSKLLDVRSDGR